jgi:hypothetical protein
VWRTRGRVGGCAYDRARAGSNREESISNGWDAEQAKHKPNDTQEGTEKAKIGRESVGTDRMPQRQP